MWEASSSGATLFLVWRWLPSGCILTRQEERGLWSLALLIMAPIQSWRPPLMTSSKPNYLPKSLPPNIITWGINASIHEFCRGVRRTQTFRLQGYVLPMCNCCWWEHVIRCRWLRTKQMWIGDMYPSEPHGFPFLADQQKQVVLQTRESLDYRCSLLSNLR